MKFVQRSFVLIKMSLIFNTCLTNLWICSDFRVLTVSFYIFCPYFFRDLYRMKCYSPTSKMPQKNVLVCTICLLFSSISYWYMACIMFSWINALGNGTSSPLSFAIFLPSTTFRLSLQSFEDIAVAYLKFHIPSFFFCCFPTMYNLMVWM